MKIAIIGSGISGMTAARLLSKDHEVTLFEADSYIGGHTRTVHFELEGAAYAVDTGFIVFNDKTYPNFIRLLDTLGVESRPSDMSFSVHCERSGMEYRPSTLNSLFAQRSNIVNPAFYRMLADILRFRNAAPRILEAAHDRLTLGEYFSRHSYSDAFLNYFTIPMGAAVWSADPEEFGNFPIRLFVEFFTNHGFLNIEQPQWRVIKGGSSAYIDPLIQPFKQNIRLNTPVEKIERREDYVLVTFGGGQTESYDQAVMAVHSDQALKMLADPSEDEKRILGAIPYQPNEVVLHTDASLLPKRKTAWASWNYRIPKHSSARATLTYNMNMLQSIDAPRTFCVSLNQSAAIQPDSVLRTFTYEHPVYTPESLSARRKKEQINGVNRTWYCGAYWGYGFHEDGVNSALDVCKHFGRSIDDA